MSQAGIANIGNIPPPPSSDLHVSPFIVSSAGITNGASYTTIQSACDAANSAGGGIVVIQPGDYAENLTCYDKVHIICLQFSDAGGGVNLTGVHTPPTSGGFVCRNIRLISATHIFSSNAAGSAHLVLGDCEVIVTNGYTFNLPNWTGKLESFDVNAAVGTNDGYVNNTGGSVVAIFDCSVGSGTVNTMTVSGNLFTNGTSIYCPINFVTGCVLAVDYTTFSQTTISNNTTGHLRNCSFTGGASAAITMSSSGAIELSHAIVSSSNNPAIAGAGSGILTYSDITFLSNASLAGTLTLATVSWQPYAKAIAATDGTKVGTAAFNSSQFTVDSNGFVSSSVSPQLGVYGDGSDGTQTFDGSSVVLGLTPSSSTYTLARDVYLAAATINNGVSIITNGFRFYCKGTLTNNGTLKNNGNDGTTGGNGGTNLTAGSLGGTRAAGGNGNTGAGGNGGNVSSSLGGTGGVGGAGGSAAGSAGTNSLLSLALPRMIPFSSIGSVISGSTVTAISTGSGGSGGGGDGVNKGGGGGSAGGHVNLTVYRFAGTGNIQALGGNGGNGAVGGTNCGGGGGGGGGIVIITSNSVSSSAVSGQTVSVAGGTHGTGSGSGANGNDGNPGTSIFVAN